MTTPAPERDVAWTPDDDTADSWAEFRTDVDRREPVMYPATAPRWPWLIGREAS